MCGVGQNLVTAQVVFYQKSILIFFGLVLGKERRRDTNDDKEKK